MNIDKVNDLLTKIERTAQQAVGQDEEMADYTARIIEHVDAIREEVNQAAEMAER